MMLHALNGFLLHGGGDNNIVTKEHILYIYNDKEGICFHACKEEDPMFDTLWITLSTYEVHDLASSLPNRSFWYTFEIQKSL